MSCLGDPVRVKAGWSQVGHTHVLAAPRPQVYGIRTRSRAVEIFTTCAHMICNMEELEKVSGPLPGQLACPAVLWDVGRTPAVL